MAKVHLNLKDTDYGVSVNISCDTDPTSEITPAMMMARAITEFVAHLNAESYSNEMYLPKEGEVRSH